MLPPRGASGLFTKVRGLKQSRTRALGTHDTATSTHDTRNMGMVMGKISEEMPAFTVLHKAVSYEVRKYGPSVVAECSYGPGGWEASDGGSPFGALARYIGVFGKAQNEQKGASEAIAMTAPVLVTPPASQKIAMTAPVLVTPSRQLVESGPASRSFGLVAAWARRRQPTYPGRVGHQRIRGQASCSIPTPEERTSAQAPDS